MEVQKKINCKAKQRLLKDLKIFFMKNHEEFEKNNINSV